MISALFLLAYLLIFLFILSVGFMLVSFNPKDMLVVLFIWLVVWIILTYVFVWASNGGLLPVEINNIIGCYK